MLKFAPEHLYMLLERWLDGSVQLPGIGVVHGIIVTSNNQVVLAKRGSQTTYSPDRWSASFEEQLVDQDFVLGKEHVAGAAAKRGLSEEFGRGASVTAINVLGLIVEMPIANLAVVVLVHVKQTFEELLLCWSDTASAQNNETVELRSVVASVGELGNLIESRGKMRFHPTSLLRLKMLRRRLLAKF